jgi:hypothetical protein
MTALDEKKIGRRDDLLNDQAESERRCGGAIRFVEIVTEYEAGRITRRIAR